MRCIGITWSLLTILAILATPVRPGSAEPAAGRLDVALDAHPPVPDDPDPNESRRHGGPPNTAAFNGNTECSAVLALFDNPAVVPTTWRMQAFIAYARATMLKIDRLEHEVNGKPLVTPRFTPKDWDELPLRYARLCRPWPGMKLDEANWLVFQAERAGR